MIISTYIASAGASFLYILLKAFQQLSVVHHKDWRWITPVSIGMGLCEVFIMGSVAIMAVNIGGWAPLAGLGVSLGVGGAAGALTGMFLHKRMRLR